MSSGLCVGDAEVACTLSAHDAATRVLGMVGGARFACVWSSPRQRCLAPARLLAEKLQLPLRIDERLLEISLGQWQMRSWAEIESTDGERYRSWLANWLTEAPPGGERPEQILRRVQSWWNDLGPGSHLLMAHAGVIRALRVCVTGLSWVQAMGLEVRHLDGECFLRAPESG